MPHERFCGVAPARGDRGSQSASCAPVPGEPVAALPSHPRRLRDRSKETLRAAHARHIAKKRKLIAFLHRHEELVTRREWGTLARLAHNEGVVVRKSFDMGAIVLALQLTWKRRAYYESALADTEFRMSRSHNSALRP